MQATIDIMLQMAQGMEYLHDHEIVHRDLKSSNILVAPLQVALLCDEGYADVKSADFGLTKTLAHDLTNPTRVNVGTTRWRAPEACKEADLNIHCKIDWKTADVYSFAMTCSEILTGRFHLAQLNYPAFMVASHKGKGQHCQKHVQSV